MKFFKDTVEFIKAVAHDSRIPERDKMVVLTLLALVISPFDLIPDWIPFFGALDDIVILAIVLDYFFRVLGDEILLSHYPWGMKSYVRLKQTAKFIAALTPGWVRDRIWKYKPSPY